MNGSIAQIVAITAFGNLALNGGKIDNFLNSNSTAQYCEKIRFIDWVPKGLLKKKYGEEPLAESFESWIDFLKNNQVKTLWLHYIPSEKQDLSDRMASAFVGGGGRWLIEAKHGNSSDYWEGKWEVTDSKSKEKRIWTVTYARISRNDAVRISEHSGIEGMKLKLGKAIHSCSEFSLKNKIEFFHKCFITAENCLTTNDFSSDLVYHKDMIPKSSYSMEAQQILFACQPAWVFGGMGSWNDLGFDGKDQETYDQISEELYKSICESIANATNTFKK